MKTQLNEFCKKKIPLLSYPIANLIEQQRYKRAEQKYDNSKIIQYKNCARKKRCFIVATGPSLTLADVELIKGEDTFGINSCYKMFEKTDWRPTYYCVTDGAVWNRIHEEIEKINVSPLFYTERNIQTDLHDAIPMLSKVAYPLYPGSRLTVSESLFSMDATKYVYVATTVVYSVIQLAVTMGYKEIILIGADCNYNTTQPYSSLTSYNMSTPRDAGEAMMRGYVYIEEFSKTHGFQVLNATRGGMLEAFKRVQLEKLF